MRPRPLGVLLMLTLILIPFMGVGHASKNGRNGARAAKTTPIAEKEAAPVADPVPPAAQPSAAASATSAPPAAPAAPAPVTTPAATSAPSFLSAGGTLLLGSLVLVGLLYGASRLMRRLPIGRLLPSAEGPIRVTARTRARPSIRW